MKNIMIDIETASTSKNAAILSIGAVEFDDVLGIVDEFYVNIALQSCVDKGLEIGGTTFEWWLKQDKEAMKILSKNKVPLKDALKSLKEWLGKGNFQIWGCGSDFDNVILENAFKAFNSQAPWGYHENRCFRTIKSSFPQVEIDFKKLPHYALDDAKHQALHLLKIIELNDLTYIL